MYTQRNKLKRTSYMMQPTEVRRLSDEVKRLSDAPAPLSPSPEADAFAAMARQLEVTVDSLLGMAFHYVLPCFDFTLILTGNACIGEMNVVAEVFS